MAKLDITLEDMAGELVLEHIKALCKQAYEQGVEDGRSKFSHPEILTKKHLTKIFQIEMATVDKLIAIPNFPKFSQVRARYPRDQVFEWIKQNSSWVEANTNYFKKGVI